jgi:uncharacterized protein
MPAYSPDNTGEEQGMQVGQHHDGMHFFPIDGSSTDGLLVMNHEYIEPRYLHGELRRHRARFERRRLPAGRAWRGQRATPTRC